MLAAAGVPEQCRPRVLWRREVHGHGSLLGAQRHRLVGASKHADRSAECRETVQHVGVPIGGSDGEQRDVADLGRKTAQAAERDERDDRQARALHVLRDRSCQGVSATEG